MPAEQELLPSPLLRDSIDSVGEQTIEATRGSFIRVPRGLMHSFGNTGIAPASFLEFFSPAGMEGYFEQRTALAQASLRTGEPDYSGMDREVHAALARAYHMEFV